MGYSLPRSSVHGISQARILEWVAISFSRGPSQPRDQTHIFCIDRQIHHHWVTWEAHEEEIPFISLRSLALLHLVYTQGRSWKSSKSWQDFRLCFLSSREPYKHRRLSHDVNTRDNVSGVCDHVVKCGSTRVTFLFPNICGIFSLFLYLLALEYHTYRHIFKYNDYFVSI